MIGKRGWRDLAILLGPACAYTFLQALWLWRDSEQFLRSVGGLLQIVAVAEILLDVSAVRRRLVPGYVGVRPRAERILARLPGRGRSVRVAAVTAMGVLTVTGTVTTRVRRGEAAMSLDERVTYHRQLLDELDTTIDRLRDEQAQKRAKLDERIEQASTDLRTLIEDVDQRHRKVATGGLRLRLWSVLVLLVGIAFQTWAPEISAAFQD